jgi:hypothetical protein
MDTRYQLADIIQGQDAQAHPFSEVPIISVPNNDMQESATNLTVPSAPQEEHEASRNVSLASSDTRTHT